MTKIKVFFLAALFVLSGLFIVSAQEADGVLTGRVFMPQVKKEKRTFRGRMYRNRLSSGRKQAQKSETLQSPFIDVIIVANPLSFKVDTEPLEDIKIIQKNAQFIPRVVPVTRSTVVKFINRDKFYHNVFSVTPGARFNLGRRPTGSVMTHRIERSGEIKIFCDIHAQMNSTILSLDTPYFTRVQPGGSYKLENLPDGDYLVEVYHPDLTGTEQQITIRSGEHVQRNFSLSR